MDLISGITRLEGQRNGERPGGGDWRSGGCFSYACLLKDEGRAFEGACKPVLLILTYETRELTTIDER